MSQPQFHRRTCRPRDAVEQASRDYPGAWGVLDQFRADRGQQGLPDWPAWCYLPMAAAYAVVSGGGPRRVAPERAGDVARLAALAAWRMTQGIYRFDPAVFDAVRSTPVAGDIPADVLYRLPEWCVYIETPGMQALGAALRRAYQAEQTGGGDAAGEHAGPRPHIRRAHWHGYWSGPRDGARRYDLRWMPPIAVAMGEATPADLPAVVRAVR